jgi:hypothetical protein
LFKNHFLNEKYNFVWKNCLCTRIAFLDKLLLTLDFPTFMRTSVGVFSMQKLIKKEKSNIKYVLNINFL